MRNYSIMIYSDYFKGFDEIIFDLDDTLIYERDYLFSAYLDISERFGSTNTEKSVMFSYLVENFNLGNRSELFNNFICTFSLKDNDMLLMLYLLRNANIKEGLRLTSEAKILLHCLMTLNMKYDIITNGNPIQQANKLRQINWEGLPSPTKVVFANEYKPKPSPDSFFKTRASLCESKILYVGDSEVDDNFAKNCGIEFFKLIIKDE